MNYFGNFDAKVSDALGPLPFGHVQSETVHAAHVPSDAIVVSDAHLLFGAEFTRTGVDLVLSGDGREVVLHDYFKGEKRAALASPDGAHLDGDLVTALAGQVQYAQADGSAIAHQVIGHVTKLVGTATAIRNGVSIILNNGENVEKGDVVQSGSDSTLGITFIDGTVFGLSSNARMVLNEMVYDPNGSNNSSLLSLVAGTITFVAGETAKHGDMKVDTPVATMGIRGTAVLVEIDFNVPGQGTPDAKFQVLVEPDGTTGSYILFDKTTLTPLAVVNQAGQQINISNGVLSQTLSPLSPEIQKLINDVFTLKFTDNSNTKSLEHFTDTIIPTDIFGPLKFAGLNSNAPAIPVIVNLVVTGGESPNSPASAKGHIPEAPRFQQIADSAISELSNTTNSPSLDKASGLIQLFDVNVSDHPTVSASPTSFTYQNSQHQDVTASLNNQQLADIAKVEAAITVTQDSILDNDGNGTATWHYQVADGAFDFLAAGEKLTLTYTATVDNNYQPLDQASSQTFTITITGTNDVPVITTSQQNISFAAAGTDTKGGDLIPNTATSGKLIFTDPDLTDTHTVAVKMTSALLDGQPFSATVGQAVIDELSAAVTASIAKGNDSTGSGTGTIDWSLANLQVYLADLVPNGESLVLTYAVTVTDSQGATSVQDIVVTIGGNNAEVLAWIDTNPIPPGGALWSTALNWEGDETPDTGHDVVINNNQVIPKTPTFPVTVNADAGAKSLVMNDFSDGNGIPTLDVEANVTLTIAGALNLNTDTATDPDTGAALVLPTAEAIINNFGTISVGGIAELLKSSVLNNHGKFVLNQGGDFGDQSSITNSGTIEIVSGTLTSEVGIANFVTTTVEDSSVTVLGTIQVDGGATLKLTDGAVVTNGQVTLGSLSMLDIEKGAASLPAGTPDATLDGVTVIGTGGPAPSTIEIGALGAAILMLDDGAIIKNGNLTIAGSSALDITTSGATLDGVNVTGTNGTAGLGAALGGLYAHAAVSLTASTIEVGTTTTTGTVLTLDDGTTITNGNLIIDAGNALDTESSAGATLDGVNVTNSGTIQIDSSATLTLEGGTTISGGTIDDVGTLSVGASNEIENATINGGGDLTVTSGTLTLSEVTLDDVTLAGSFTNLDTLTIKDTVTLNGATISGDKIDDTGTIIGTGMISAIVAGSGGLTASGGTLTLTGDNTYGGATVINEGATLALSDSGSIANSSGVIDDGTFDISGLTAATSIVTLSGDGSVNLGGNTLTLSNANDTFSGAIDGNGGLALTVGTETLTGDNLYTGVTTINGGTLKLSGTGSIEDSSGVVDDGTFDISATTSGASIVTLSGDGAVTLGARTLTLSDASTTFSGVIGGSGGVTLTAGTETLTGDNTYSGATTINGGTLALSGTGSIEDSSGVIDDGTFDISGLTAATSIVTLSGDGSVNLGGNTLTLSNANDTFSGAIDGNGGLALTVGTETLTGDNLYTGVTTINGGTLKLSGTAGSIGASSDVIDNGTFDISATTSGASIVTLSGDGAVKLGAETLTLTDASTTFSGGIGGSGGVTLTAGTETLTGDNTYSGATTINGGTLALSGTGSIKDSSGVIDNGTFDISATALGASIATLSGNGAVKLGAETLTLTDASTTFSGTISSTGGTLAVAGGTLTLGTMILDNVTLSGSFGNSGTLTIDDTATLNGATITGGTIDIVGVLDSTGTSFIDGATIINMNHIDVVSGTLNFDPTPFTNAGLFEVQSSSTFSGEVVTNSLTVGNVTTNGTIQVDQGGTLTLDGAAINGGNVSNSGTIDVTAASSINTTVSFVNAGTVDADGAELDLVGTIIKNAGGTLKTTGKGVLDLENATINGGTLSGTIATAIGNTSGSTLNGVTLALSTLVTAVVGVLELTGNIANNGEFDATTGLLDLDNAHITGGSFGGGGTIATASTFNTLNDVAIAGITTVKVTDGTSLDLVGTISDHGTIALNAAGHVTGLTISGNVSLTGGGNVTMTDDSHNFIASDGSPATLTNSDTISGAGMIGDGNLTLVNDGTIDATGAHALIIDTGVNNFFGPTGNLTVTNNGVLEASAGHTLLIDDNVVNNGLIESDSSGAHSSAYVGVTGNITGTGSIDIFNNATIEIGGSVSSGQTVTFGTPGGSVATNGLLILDDSHDFHGTIAGLTENPVESQENQVDLRDLAYLGPLLTHAHFSHSNDTVTVSNFFDSVTLNVSGNSSGSFEVSYDGHGGTLLSDPAASGTVTVDSNQTLDISAASSATIDFTNTASTTGALVLDDSKDFTGTIIGFTGDGTTANSDLIDITDVNIADVAMSKTTYTDHGNDTGTLTLYDAGGQALDSINLAGDYQLANFTIENDGNGGTLIVDPPVNASAQAPATNTAMASNQNSTGTAPTDGFVFNFAGLSHASTPDFHPDLDAFRLGGSMLTNLHTASNAVPDQGNLAMALGSEGHDHFGLTGFAKAHLHSADFHFV